VSSSTILDIVAYYSYLLVSVWLTSQLETAVYPLGLPHIQNLINIKVKP